MLELLSDDLDCIIADNPVCMQYSTRKYSCRKTKLSVDKLLETEGIVNNYAFSVILNYQKCFADAIPKSNQLVKISDIDYKIGKLELDSFDVKMTLHLEKLKRNLNE